MFTAGFTALSRDPRVQWQRRYNALFLVVSGDVENLLEAPELTVARRDRFCHLAGGRSAEAHR